MKTATGVMTGEYAPPDMPALDALVFAINDELRRLHEAGNVVLVAEVRQCKKTDPLRALPQIRIEVRTPEEATPRPEVLDA